MMHDKGSPLYRQWYKRVNDTIHERHYSRAMIFKVHTNTTGFSIGINFEYINSVVHECCPDDKLENYRPIVHRSVQCHLQAPRTSNIKQGLKAKAAQLEP